MKALVTGSAGFVGRHMTAELRTRGYDVIECDIAEGRDVFNLFAGVADLPLRFDLVVHAAAAAPHRAAIDTVPMHMAYNLRLDAAMFDWAVRTQQRRILYLSSCAAIDCADDYGWTKLTGERLAAAARRTGISVTVVRPYSGYGEDQSEDFPFRAIVERARRGEDPFEIWGDGTQVRDWIHIDDVIAGALAVAESGTEEPISLCTGRGVSILELARHACLAAGYPAPPVFKPTGAHAGVARRVGDPERLHRYHIPRISLEEGIDRALGG